MARAGIYRMMTPTLFFMAASVAPKDSRYPCPFLPPLLSTGRSPSHRNPFSAASSSECLARFHGCSDLELHPRLPFPTSPPSHDNFQGPHKRRPSGKDAPELLHLDIGAPMFNLSAFSLLNHLELRDISVSQFYEVLIFCPRLVYLWTSLDSEGGISDSPVPILSPYLETLLLSANTGEYGRIFDSLTLPQLVWLRPVDNVPFDVLQTFIVRSACDLYFLHLEVDDWTPEQFREFLDSIHSLSRLSLNFPPPDAISSLNASHLQHCSRTWRSYCWCSELNYDLIITIFTSRRAAGWGLDSFTVQHSLGSFSGEDTSPWALCDVAAQFDTLAKLDFKFTADDGDLHWNYEAANDEEDGI
ncbi:hypothetical protein C8J57DRAFT_1525003 [Mycena rebaudengoi]|nr:hypothetical protein C8J57DRAFT_1525003 [Mycena rebaudengoi]